MIVEGGRYVMAVGRLSPQYEHIRAIDSREGNIVLRRRAVAAAFRGELAVLKLTDSGALECVITNPSESSKSTEVTGAT